LLVDADDWEGMGGWNNLGGYSRSYQRLFAWQERELLRRADGVTAASHVLVRLATTLRRSDERLWRVPNGCGVSTVAPGCPGQQPTVLIFSRLHDLDPMVVVDTLATILRRRPHVRVCVAGGQLHGEEVRWKAALQVAGIAGAVHLLGWIDPTLLPGLLQMTSVALVPTANTLVNRSRCSAKLGVLLSSGVPVVATAVGENSTYIRQDVDGVLVDPGNVMALALATLHLLDSAPLRARLGNSAARRMREEFSWPLIADTVERAYQTCYSTGEHLKKGRSRR
jgi:glycosyltransferase involved in cell wall biosynthesis